MLVTHLRTTDHCIDRWTGLRLHCIQLFPDPRLCFLCSKILSVTKKKGNGQKREFQVLFGQKWMYPENNSGIECCWPYLIGQHPLSPVFGQKRPGTPGNRYFTQLPPVFGHFLFRFWPFNVRFRWATGLLEQINMGQNFAQVAWRLTKFSHFSVNNFGSSQLYSCLPGVYSRSFITPA